MKLQRTHPAHEMFHVPTPHTVLGRSPLAINRLKSRTQNKHRTTRDLQSMKRSAERKA